MLKTSRLAKFVLPCLCLFSNAAVSQSSSWTDSLNTQSPQWQGDTAEFLWGPGGLQSNANAAGKLELYRRSPISHLAHWQVQGNLEFNPSSANYATVQLMGTAHQRYELRLGGNATDDLQLLYCTDTGCAVLASVPGYLNASKPAFDLHISRDSTLGFTCWDLDTTLFYIRDSSLLNGHQLGLRCTFTKSRAKKFQFTYLAANGVQYVDSVPPSCPTASFTSPHTMQFHFDEPCVPHGPNYITSGLDTAYFPQLNPFSWLATFSAPLPIGNQSFVVPSARDTAMNVGGMCLVNGWVEYPRIGSAQIVAFSPKLNNTNAWLLLHLQDSLPANTSLVLQREDGKQDSLLLGTHPPGHWLLHDSTALALPTNALSKPTVATLFSYNIPIAQQLLDPNQLPLHMRQGHHYLHLDTLTWSAKDFNPRPSSTPPLTDRRPTSFTATALQNPLHWEWLPTTRMWSRLDSTLWFGALAQQQELPENHQWSWNRPLALQVAGEAPLQHPQLVINELHTHSTYLPEFIELYAPNNSLLGVLQWAKLHTSYGYQYVKPLPVEPFPFTDGIGLPAMKGGELRAFAPPQNLPNEAACYHLLSEQATVLDSLCHLKASHHLSWEKLALSLPGTDTLAWAPHSPDLQANSEGSPNAANSISFLPIAAGVPWVSVIQAHASLHPLHWQPMAAFDVAAPANSLFSAVIHAPNGQAIHRLYHEHHTAGAQRVLVDAATLQLSSGIYTVVFTAEHEGGTLRARKSFSVFE